MMQPGINEKNSVAMIAEVAPYIRGAMSRASEIEGKPDRVVLAFEAGTTPGIPSVSARNLQQLRQVLGGDVRKVGVPGLGVFTAGAVSGDLGGQVAIVTGGAGGLGFSIARTLHDQGAKVALLDISREPVNDAAKQLDGIGLACDVTSAKAVQEAVERVVAQFGGVDILISNAGAAQRGSLLELGDDDFEKAFALNFWSHHYVSRAVVKVMQKQGTGGALVFNVSKQAINPGPDFGAYGTPKAALMALMRQYAVEHGKDGITSNAVNADRIRTGLMTDQMIEERSKARGLTPRQYMRGNLVQREVTGQDVAEAFLHLARARTSTGAVLTVDGGNVGAMMR